MLFDFYYPNSQKNINVIIFEENMARLQFNGNFWAEGSFQDILCKLRYQLQMWKSDIEINVWDESPIGNKCDWANFYIDLCILGAGKDNVHINGNRLMWGNIF